MAGQKQTALVTGASSGHGQGDREAPDRGRLPVYVAARHIEKMDDLAQLGARPLRMDISKDAQIKAAVDTILAEAGGVDVLVNNAGFGLYGPIEKIDIAKHGTSLK